MSQKRPRGPDADVVRFDPEFDRLAGDWINTAPGLVAIEAARPFEVPFTGDVRHTPPAEGDTELQQADRVTPRPASPSHPNVC
ncbi:hypothetical protein ACWGLP_04130 [Streptomyces lydicus]